MLNFVLCYNITISDWITTLHYYGIDYFLHEHYFNHTLLYLTLTLICNLIIKFPHQSDLVADITC